MRSWPGERIADTLGESADKLRAAVGSASTDQLQQDVDLVFTKMPLWQATGVSTLEAVLHNWDAHARREPGATIPTPWAVTLGQAMANWASMIANRESAVDASGAYLLQVADGVGPVTITAQDGNVTAERGAAGAPDVTLHLTADQYVRLITGRLPLQPAIESGAVKVEGDAAKATGLNRIFTGIAN
jgi:putative sterol carrier protein